MKALEKPDEIITLHEKSQAPRIAALTTASARRPPALPAAPPKAPNLILISNKNLSNVKFYLFRPTPWVRGKLDRAGKLIIV
jgi:hypothetical protein